MADQSYGAAAFVGIIGVLIIADGLPKDAPCVYRHSKVVDWFGTNERKRNCAELLSEANSRLEAQQVQISDVAARLADATSEAPYIASRRRGDLSIVGSSEAPTLTAEVRQADDASGAGDD